MAKSQFVTMADVAREAGVHVSTVSLALRNSILLPEATRRTVQEVAARLNYRPHPDIVALMERRRRGDRVQTPPVIAFVTAGPARGTWRSSLPDAEGLWRGMEKRATELGFRVEEFWLEEGKMTSRRFAEILHVRNINGVLLAPLPSPLLAPELDWRRFSVAAFGLAANAQHHRIASDCFGDMMLALEKCQERGFRRVGFAGSEETHGREGVRWLAAYLARQHAWGVADKLPPLISSNWCRSTVEAWIHQHRPDAIVCERPEQLRPFLAASGELDEVRLITLSGAGGQRSASGIHPQVELLGARGIDLVASLLRQNKRGLATNPELVLLPGVWRDGALPSKSVAAPLKEERLLACV